MKRSRYREPDYAFGQLMLTLRTQMGLTQAGLAERLGISRRTVSTWELGSNYPKAAHLKELIVLAVQFRSWAAGREEEEIQALWRAAHQKVLLDQRWLQGLLGKERPRLALVVPQPDEQTHADERAMAQPALNAHTFSGHEGVADATMSEAALFGEQLLTTKFFIPSPSHALIPRPRLTARLSASLQHKLTLISAPAGFGKTTLLAAWVQALPPGNPHVAWVSLDEGDNDPLRFWEYALTALDNCKPGLCTFLVTFLHTQPSLSVHYLLTALINTLVKQTEQFLLILDDYHVITEPEVHSSLTYLLEHLPPQLHLILETRADPPLSLSRLRARDQVFEVRTEQLRCTSEEASAFFTQAMRIPLTSEEIREVEVRTEGWIAGLQLLALSLRGHTDPGALLAEMHGTHRYILDYLTDEVLRQQPEVVQTFLLRTSILERLCAPLCDRVMGQSGSQLVLEHLEQANLFVVALDERRQWYRYHALFAETLRYRLQQAEGEAVAALHLRASQWYAEEGNLHEAVRHATSAGDWQRVADLIEPAQAVIWSSHEHARLRRWLEQLPVEVVRSRPRLCLASAKILYLVAPYNPMDRWLQDAETAVRARFPATTSGDAETAALPLAEQREWDDFLGEIASFRAAVTAFTLGDGHAALAFCEEALAHLSPQNLGARAEVAYAKSLAYHALGEIVPAIQSAREATALAQAGENISQIVAYTCRTAYSLRLQGKLHEVVQMAQLAATQGSILLAQEKATEALSLLEPLRGDAERQERWNHVIEMQVLQALAHAMGDEEQEALAVLAQAVRLAEAEGYIRIFVDEGAPLASMLSRLREREDKQMPTGYMDTLLAAFGKVGRAHDATGAGSI
jgi:LuxR family maltose regulon positive regulatory protein